MAKVNTLPTEEQVEEFRMLSQLLGSIYLEMKEFSKKKPDEPLNKFKVKNVNRVLEPVKNILILEPTNMFLDIMDDESLPTNSDAILVIGQFQASMERFQKKYTGKYYWKTKENPTGDIKRK